MLRRTNTDGSRRAIEHAGARLLTEGRMWARRVNLAQQRLRDAVDYDADDDAIAERRRVLLRERADHASLLDAVERLEHQIDASADQDAIWVRRARTETQRVRAGLAGNADPDPTAPGIARGWRSLPRLFIVGTTIWLLVSAALIVAVLVDRL